MRYKSYGTPLKVCQGTRYAELVWGCVTAHVTWNLCEGVSRHMLRGTCVKVCHGTCYVELVWRCVTAQVTWNLCEGVSRHRLRGTCVKVCHGTGYVELVWKCVTAQVTWNLCEGVSRHRLRGTCVKVCHGTGYVELVWRCVTAQVTWNLSWKCVIKLTHLLDVFNQLVSFCYKWPFRSCLSFWHHVKNKNIESSFFAIPDTWPNLNENFEVLTAGVPEYANVGRYAVLTGIQQSLVNEYERAKS